MVKRLFDLGFACAVFLTSIWFWFVADGFPISRRYAQIDTEFWPKIVFATLALVAGALVVRMTLELVRDRRLAPVARPVAFDPVDPDQRPIAVIFRVVIMASLVLVYYFGFRYVGFAIATVLFLWAGSFVLIYRNWVVKLVFAPVFTLALTLFFSRALSLPLPRGVGPFYELNRLLY